MEIREVIHATSASTSLSVSLGERSLLLEIGTPFLNPSNLGQKNPRFRDVATKSSRLQDGNKHRDSFQSSLFQAMGSWGRAKKRASEEKTPL